MTHRLTVILPVYNAMPYLPAAVESILGQSLVDFALILVNDGSTDNSGEYLRSLKDPRIVLIEQTNQGLGPSLNTGLRSCHSEYAARMDADDISLPDRLRCQLDYLDNHPEVVMVGTQIEFLFANATQAAFRSPTDHDGIRARLLKGQAGVCHPSLMFRTAAAMACGGYPSGSIGEDVEFCLRMCEHGLTANLDQVLFQYRLHTDQLSQARCSELIAQYRYAAHCKICRRRGAPEPALDEFLRHASFLSRWRWSAEAQALIQYRTGRMRIASGKPVEGFFRLALSGICRPISTTSRVAQAVGMLLRSPAN